jgi:hypothetical protein
MPNRNYDAQLEQLLADPSIIGAGKPKREKAERDKDFVEVSLIWKAITGNRIDDNVTAECLRLGCTPTQFKNHIKNLIPKGMRWGKLCETTHAVKTRWQFDHLFPCFVAGQNKHIPNLVNLVNSYQNIRPADALWNKIKSDAVILSLLPEEILKIVKQNHLRGVNRIYKTPEEFIESSCYTPKNFPKGILKNLFLHP